MGENVHLSCPEVAENGTKIEWDRLEGLPEGSTVSHGVLIIPKVAYSDEGSYHCVIHQPEPLPQIEGYVYLTVTDFIPEFTGENALELPPLKGEAYKDFSMHMTFKPSDREGLLFYTERGDEESEHPSAFHSLSMNQGKVVYQYQVGDEPVKLESSQDVELGKWNSVEMRNTPDGALLILNGDDTQSNTHDSFNPTDGDPKQVYLGGLPHIVHKPHIDTKKFFVGVISSLELSGEPVPLGSAERILSTIKPFNACAHSSCLNGGQCVSANVPSGYVCSCSIEYRGSQCQFRSASCSDSSDCGTGACMDDGSCLCPAGRKGNRCQETALLTKGFKFISNHSFIALPSPKTPKDFKISMKLGPENEKDSMLLYVGEDYSPYINYFSLSVKDGQIIQSYRDSYGFPQHESIHTIVHSGDKIDLSVKFEDGKQKLMKDGQMVGEFSSPLRVGTEILIGGLPPGVPSNPFIPSNQPYNGCISELTYNDEEINVHDSSQFYSGDIEGCEPEVIPTEIVEEEIVVDDAKEEEEEKDEEPIESDIEDIEDKDVAVSKRPIINKEDAGKEEIDEEEVEEVTTTIEPEEEVPTDYEEITNIYETTSDIVIPSIATTQMIPITTTESISSTVKPIEEEVIESTQCYGCSCHESECGDHGDCVDVNSTHFECQCHLYYDGINCELFKPIDRAARFDGTAYIEISNDEFAHLSSQKNETISFNFKTTEPNGLILWQGKSTDSSDEGEEYFSVYLQDGYLVYAYELGGGVGKGKSRRTVDDGIEHTVALSRIGRDATLLLDQDEVVNIHSSGILAMLNVDGNIFIGGVPRIEERTEGLHTTNFNGCISDLSFDNTLIDLMAAALDGRRVRPCEEWLTPRKYLHFASKKRRLVRSRIKWPFF